MLDVCIFCRKRHQDIFNRFDKFLRIEKISHSVLTEFLRYVEFEINENNWNELFCLLSVMSKYGIRGDNNHLTELACILHEKMILSPTLESFNKIKNSTLLNKNLNYLIMPLKEASSPEAINTEFHRLGTLLGIKWDIYKKNIDEIEKQDITRANPDKSIINYVLYRLIGIFEQQTFDVLLNKIENMPVEVSSMMIYDSNKSLEPEEYARWKQEINSLVMNNKITDRTETFGKLIYNDLKVNTITIDNLIAKIINFHNTHAGNRTPPNWEKSSFFSFLGEIINIKNKKTLDYFKNHKFLNKSGNSIPLDGKWYNLITYVNSIRNTMTHNLRDASIEKNEAENLVLFFLIYCLVIDDLLDLILSYYKKNINEFDQVYETIKKTEIVDLYEIISKDTIKEKIIAVFGK